MHIQNTPSELKVKAVPVAKQSSGLHYNIKTSTSVGQCQTGLSDYNVLDAGRKLSVLEGEDSQNTIRVIYTPCHGMIFPEIS